MACGGEEALLIMPSMSARELAQTQQVQNGRTWSHFPGVQLACFIAGYDIYRRSLLNCLKAPIGGSQAVSKLVDNLVNHGQRSEYLSATCVLD